jgi:GNAT superfamily N-acetyltransferase
MLAPMFDAYRQFYGQFPDLDGAREFLSERLEQEQSVIFLALKDRNGCGFTQLYPAFSSVAMRPVWILNDLFVTPEARRLGVGKCLMQEATEFSAENGAKRLVLSTAVGNRAARLLYEETGWVKDEAFVHYNYEL